MKSKDENKDEKINVKLIDDKRIVLYNISKIQIQRINYFIKKVKEDIGNAGIDEYEKIYITTFASIDEQKEGYGNIYDLIKKVEDSILESNLLMSERYFNHLESENDIKIRI